MPVTNENHLKILEEVLSIPTAPFYEQKVIQYIQKFAQEHDIPAKQDMYGNLILEYQLKDVSVPAMGMMAHTDHPGFEVEESTERFIKLGVRGSITCPQVGDQVMLFNEKEETKVKVTEILTYPDETTFVICEPPATQSVYKWGILDIIPFRREQSKIHSRAIDDLAGCAAMICLLDILCKNKAPAHVYAIFTRAEEMGFLGACGLVSNNTLPKALPMLSLEASRLIPGVIQGRGPVIRVGDRFCIFDSKIIGFLTKIAQGLSQKDRNFRFQKAIMEGGVCEGSVVYAFGYPTAGMALPLGCYHNRGESGRPSPENINPYDWYGMIEILYEAVINTPQLLDVEERNKAQFLSRFEPFKEKLKIS